MFRVPRTKAEEILCRHEPFANIPSPAIVAHRSITKICLYKKVAERESSLEEQSEGLV